MGQQMEFLVVYVLCAALVLPGACEFQVGIAPSLAVSSASPSIGHQATTTTFHDNLQGADAPSPTSILNGAALHPPLVQPPKPVYMPPVIHTPSMPPNSQPGQHLKENEGSRVSSPSIGSQPPNAPATTVLSPSMEIVPKSTAAVDDSPPSSISPSQLPQTRKSAANGLPPSSNTPFSAPISPAKVVPFPPISPSPLPHSTGAANGTPPTSNPPIADVLPPPSISPSPMPKTRKGAANVPPPSSNTPFSVPVPPALSPSTEIFPKPPPAHPSISGPPPSFHGAPQGSPPSFHGAPNAKDFDRSAIPPASFISPVIHGKSNGVPSSAPSKEMPSHFPPASFISPVIRGKSNGVPSSAPSKEIPSHLSPVHHSPVIELVPVSSPNPHQAVVTPSIAPPPISNSQSRKRRKVEPPASAPTDSNHQRSEKRDASSPSIAPSNPHAIGPVISPLPSLSPQTFPKNRERHRASPPAQGPSSFVESPHPSISTKAAHAPSPLSMSPSSRGHGPILSPVPSPSVSLPVAPSGRNHRPSHSPTPSPSGSLHVGPGAPLLPPARSLPHPPVPMPHPTRALPPPPPNLDCTPLSCTDPYTNSPPGSPCVCVRPMKVGLQLGVALYTFFPLVSELAQEIASGTFMKQSQVRIMGANAASEQPEKTIVLIDLVPLGDKFDNTTAFFTSEKFWHKQIGIKASYFGDYNVLYVIYPGLPPSPPMSPDNINVDDGSFGNENNSRTIHPLGVDVRKRREKLGGSLIVIIVLSSVVAFVLCIGVAWFLLLRDRESSDQTRLSAQTPRTSLPLFSKASGTGPAIFGSCPSSGSGSLSSSMATYTGSAKTFSAGEMERATKKFEDSRIIGEGGFGRVYQGTLDDGTEVAVKVLKRDDQQGSREFLAEVEMLSRLHHRNLVKLIGICTEEHLHCLVYELIPNGSVESHLHGTDKETAPLDWGSRMKIALGSARGLAYLHEDSSPRVIHRDFKSSNILLEFDFTPKVSDFGLARTALEEGNEHISTRVMGTFGYVAPEYAMTGHLLVKSDVYSYGVVLLEILTGRKPVDMLQPPGQENLVSWARPLLTSKEGLETIVDPALGSNIPFDSVAKVAAIASMCVQPEVSHRPFMGEVVQALKLVCNESGEHGASGNCSQEDLSLQDPELRISTGLVPDSERVLSASEIFSTSARLAGDASGSFRRHSSSGPLRTSRSGQFWQRLKSLSRGSMSEHGVTLRFRTGTERWP